MRNDQIKVGTVYLTSSYPPSLKIPPAHYSQVRVLAKDLSRPGPSLLVKVVHQAVSHWQQGGVKGYVVGDELRLGAARLDISLPDFQRERKLMLEEQRREQVAARALRRELSSLGEQLKGEGVRLSHQVRPGKKPLAKVQLEMDPQAVAGLRARLERGSVLPPSALASFFPEEEQEPEE